ncbi:MAG: hypothetical protein Athens101428_705 [Candidatus Berkelbacteria bacterium Athens1014_28]|uniref:Signal peptidase I n=1 Tax=Candidatus Berkelbacteria bacterium Athens1014_28 TaxID=2017145 RepID=A0A554LKA8_9BACT|nr:MAG: hypothetical protein Athens101428_705 [Candidatus Berkelbacteria bacterium Athens1014_28]
MKKTLTVFGIIIAILAVFYIIARLLPSKTVESIVGNDNAISNIACSYPVRVSGSSMQEYFKEGELANFDKCFESSELASGRIIVFKDRDNNRIGIIQESVNDTYKVKQSNRNEIFTVNKQDVVAIYDK